MAVWALRQVDPKEAEDVLLKALPREKNEVVRRRIIAELVNINSQKILPEIRKSATRDTDVLVRHRAVLGLGMVGDANENAPILIQALGDDHPMVWIQAKAVLTGVGQKAVPILESALKDQTLTPKVRERIKDVLKRIKEAKAGKKVGAVSTTPSTFVAEGMDPFELNKEQFGESAIKERGRSGEYRDNLSSLRTGTSMVLGINDPPDGQREQNNRSEYNIQSSHDPTPLLSKFVSLRATEGSEAILFSTKKIASSLLLVAPRNDTSFHVSNGLYRQVRPRNLDIYGIIYIHDNFFSYPEDFSAGRCRLCISEIKNSKGPWS